MKQKTFAEMKLPCKYNRNYSQNKIQYIHSHNENEKKTKIKKNWFANQNWMNCFVKPNKNKQQYHWNWFTLTIQQKLFTKQNWIRTEFKTELSDGVMRGIKLPGARVWIGESAGPVWLEVQTRAADLCSILASSTGETNSVKLRFTWFHSLIAVSVWAGQKKISMAKQTYTQKFRESRFILLRLFRRVKGGGEIDDIRRVHITDVGFWELQPVRGKQM